MNKILTIFFLSTLCIQCNTKSKTSPVDKTYGLITEKAMVVSAREEASKVGVEIMKQGGNAFDAMIATDLALLVSYPSAGNIGGGGFMVFRKNDGTTGALDYREKAPLAATKDMYLDKNGNADSDKSQTGALAVGVPGTIAGLFEIHKKFGTLPFEKLIDPAIQLAKNGVVVTQKQAQNLNDHTPDFRAANKKTILLDKLWKKGDTIKYLKL
ncbi:gamma-glutamyltransferase, partial [bacterium]|nr:gamma-glutamyltransferase [bacterium]